MGIIETISQAVIGVVDAAIASDDLAHESKTFHTGLTIFVKDDVKDIGDKIKIEIPMIQSVKSEPNGDMLERQKSIEVPVFILSRCEVSDVAEFKAMSELANNVLDLDWEQMGAAYQYENGEMNISDQHARQGVFCAVVTLEFELK